MDPCGVLSTGSLVEEVSEEVMFTPPRSPASTPSQSPQPEREGSTSASPDPKTNEPSPLSPIVGDNSVAKEQKKGEEDEEPLPVPTADGTCDRIVTRTQKTNYRLKRVDIYRSDAIDQIKFHYSDDSVWVAGHDGGKADPRAAIMTPGEYIVSVSHERFYNYRAAGASIKLTTNKGRVFGYHPKKTSSGRRSETTTVTAAEGHEIISLLIKRGVLVGFVQQQTPSKDSMVSTGGTSDNSNASSSQGQKKSKPAPWYTVAVFSPKEDLDVSTPQMQLATANVKEQRTPTPTTVLEGMKYCHFASWKEAKAEFAAQKGELVARRPGRAVLLIDCLKSKVNKKAGQPAAVEEALALATAHGYYAERSSENVTIMDGVVMLAKHLCTKWDIAVFTLTTLFLFISSYLEVQSQMLAGSVLGMLGETAESLDKTVQGNWAARWCCSAFLHCSPAESSNSTNTSGMETFMSQNNSSSWFDVSGASSSTVDSAASDRLEQLQRAMIMAFIITKCIERFAYVFNVYIHDNVCDTRTQVLYRKVFRHVLELDQNYFDTHSSSEIRGGMNVETLSNLVAWNIPYIITKALKLVLIIYFMFTINVWLATICLVSLCIVKYGVIDALEAFQRSARRIRRKLDRLRKQVEDDSLDLITSIKIFSTEERHIDEQVQAGNRVLGHIHSAVVMRCIIEWVYGMMQTMTFGAVLFYGIRIVSEAHLTPATLTSFFFVLSDLQEVFDHLKWHYNFLIREFPDIERFLALMKEKAVLADGNFALPHTTPGQITFDGVKFEYPSRPGEPVINGLTLTLKPNTMTAIVGDSGAGKSTVAKLLMRLYDPKEGTVAIDGHPLTSVQQKSLHECIAIVSQNPELFNTSIGENIAYGAVSGTPTQADIERAAKLANCHDFIAKFRSGYDTFVGGRGAQISGGQRQRIAIARAAIRNPRILILDEATSALDAENEKLVQSALESVMKGRTTLVIAHRLSTIKAADEIVCMKEGRAVERGTHEQLMQLKGTYYNLVNQQIVGTAS